jgi:putative ABC transport system permease protein
MGTNMLVVRPGSSRGGGVRGGSGSRQSITWQDVDAIKNEVSSVRYVAPLLRTNAQVVSDSSNWQTSTNGTTNEYFAIRNWKITSGTGFSAQDEATGAKVVILGGTVVDNLYGAGADPVGQILRIKNVPFQIIGVLERKGQSGMGQDNDDAVFVPAKTYGAKIQGGLRKYVSGTVYVGAASEELTARAQTDIEELLRRRHRLNGKPDDFSVRNLADIAAAQAEGAQTLTSLLAGIALVSLLVGGIGIMNIMLVSVTERTREIGLRMAIGGKPKHILAQFVIEAVALSIVGGLLGVAFGIGAAGWLASKFGWATLIRPDIVFVAVGFSAVVGIVFGLYPAHKASRLDPIQALRYE